MVENFDFNSSKMTGNASSKLNFYFLMFSAVAIRSLIKLTTTKLKYPRLIQPLITINSPEIQRFLPACRQLNHFKRRGWPFFFSFSN